MRRINITTKINCTLCTKCGKLDAPRPASYRFACQFPIPSAQLPLCIALGLRPVVWLIECSAAGVNVVVRWLFVCAIKMNPSAAKPKWAIDLNSLMDVLQLSRENCWAAKELPSEEISLVPQKIYINMLYTHKNLKETSILFLLRALWRISHAKELSPLGSGFPSRFINHNHFLFVSANHGNVFKKFAVFYIGFLTLFARTMLNRPDGLACTRRQRAGISSFRFQFSVSISS